MPQAIVGHGVTPQNVDDFPSNCARSRKGAVYVRPDSSLTLTNDELDHIKDKHPQLFKKLRVVEEPVAVAAAVAEKAKQLESSEKLPEAAPKEEAPISKKKFK